MCHEILLWAETSQFHVLENKRLTFGYIFRFCFYGKIRWLFQIYVFLWLLNVIIIEKWRWLETLVPHSVWYDNWIEFIYTVYKADWIFFLWFTIFTVFSIVLDLTMLTSIDALQCEPAPWSPTHFSEKTRLLFVLSCHWSSV